jgi:hypothetical protein
MDLLNQQVGRSEQVVSFGEACFGGIITDTAVHTRSQRYAFPDLFNQSEFAQIL